MNFTELSLEGAFLIEPNLLTDERGFFARSFCSEEFSKQGLLNSFEQCNISFNSKKGTLRGMHFQLGEHSEAKLVRCTKGSIFDVIIDLRKDSPTFKKWVSVVLNEDNRHMLYIPMGFAHGFQTLTDNAEVFYQMSSSFMPNSARGIRWDDTEFMITWPQDKPTVISQKDLSYQDFSL